ncbi:MAG: cobyrinate a,c-diamide synthase [Rhodospirillales bacterium]|nr:MAG: cobyrinate a,c-diamide synthase [Rhodospirillales bacterium]
MTAPAPGIIIAAPASNQGKTLVTMSLIRALTMCGLRVAAAKVGPDYIDPCFHAAAGASPCHNLDPWAMRPATIAGLIGRLGENTDLIVCEGVMGLFDGVGDAAGSTADLAILTGWPIVLAMDVRGQGASAAAVLRGFATHRPDVAVTGVILNRVGSEDHAELLAAAIGRALPGLTVFGSLPRCDALALPDRHLGLVQASEHPDLDGFLDKAADLITARVDLERLRGAACAGPASTGVAVPLPPPGQRIAVARDDAFAFSYASVLEGWRAQGAEVSFFSPLNDDPPDGMVDAVHLPGGYPELHAGALSANTRFRDGLCEAAARGAAIIGECGGYMAMGHGLVDERGTRHEMAGLLPLETSFADRRLHLGYRRVVLRCDSPLGVRGTAFAGHEFHYASVLSQGAGEPLFTATDARGSELGAVGLIKGRVAGSFVHLIDLAE